jgi:hypothetical protein
MSKYIKKNLLNPKKAEQVGKNLKQCSLSFKQVGDQKFPIESGNVAD